MCARYQYLILSVVNVFLCVNCKLTGIAAVLYSFCSMCTSVVD